MFVPALAAPSSLFLLLLIKPCLLVKVYLSVMFLSMRMKNLCAELLRDINFLNAAFILEYQTLAQAKGFKA